MGTLSDEKEDRGAKSWFGVRCILRSAATYRESGVEGAVYEERITLWLAEDARQAIELAEAEVREYADDVDSEFIGFSESYRLSDEPGVGAEVFSLMRDSVLEPGEYLDRHFDTSSERRSS